MGSMSFRGRWVVLTGASAGLGREMAKILARDYGANLVLVARREARLRELATELERYGVSTEVVAADLAIEDDVQRVFDESTRGRTIYGVILNAGITHFGHHDELSFDDFKKMLALNVTSSTQLMGLFSAYLEERGERGGMLVVSSLAGLTPVAYQAAYSGTKAFLVNYACSLHHEMSKRGVSITTVTPGGIATEMTAGDRFDALRKWLMPADRCAADCLQAFEKRLYLHTPGAMYRWGTKLTKLVPERFFVGRVAAEYRKSLDHPSDR